MPSASKHDGVISLTAQIGKILGQLTNVAVYTLSPLENRLCYKPATQNS
jgi:hypothetical protein